MPENDVLALGVHYQNWRDSRMKGLKNVDPFEFFCADQILKPYLMSDAEILSGLVDDPHDGGVDGFYFFRNRVGARVVKADVWSATLTTQPASFQCDC